MKQKIIKSGKYSLAVIIPAEFTHGLGIKAGDSVDVKTDLKSGTVRMKFSGTKQLPLPTSKNK